MFPLLLFLATAPAVAQQVPADVQVDAGPVTCGHLHISPGAPQIGVDAGRDNAADQTSLRLQVAGKDVLAPNMSAPFGLVLMSLDASNAVMAQQAVVFAYTIHHGKDTVTVTFPAKSSVACR